MESASQQVEPLLPKVRSVERIRKKKVAQNEASCGETWQVL